MTEPNHVFVVLGTGVRIARPVDERTRETIWGTERRYQVCREVDGRLKASRPRWIPVVQIVPVYAQARNRFLAGRGVAREHFITMLEALCLLRARAVKLRAELDAHDRAYCTQAEPTISDADYTRLRAALSFLEEAGW